MLKFLRRKEIKPDKLGSRNLVYSEVNGKVTDTSYKKLEIDGEVMESDLDGFYVSPGDLVVKGQLVAFYK